MDFGDDFASKDQEVDPAAEFLSREQSVLGELNEELPPATAPAAAAAAPTAAAAAAAVKSEDDGFLDNNELAPGVAATSGGLESSMGSFEMIAGGSEPNDGFNISAPPPSRIEPEKIRKWREEQKQRLEEKDREEERKKEELRQQAKKELEDWLRQTEESIAKTKAASRNAEKQAAALENGGTMEPGTEWERIAKLCDFNPKVNKSGKDISRMRSIYLHLKQNPIPMQKSA